MPPQVGGEMSLFDLGRYAGKAGKKAAEMGRFFASEWLREPGAQKMLIGKAEPFLKKGIDQLSTAIRPKRNYKTNRKDLDGSGCCQILPMDLTMHHRQGPCKKDEVLMCTKQLGNSQNLEKDGHCLDTTTPALTTHWMISCAMIQRLEKFLSFIKCQQEKQMPLLHSMT